MSNSADYFTAALPEPWQILGLRLRPFSLGHYKLLHRLGCAFVAESEQKCEVSDLILGTLVCSMKPAEFIHEMEQPGFEDEVKEWGNKCGCFDVDNKVTLFKEYLEYHSKVPKYWSKSEGEASGAHWAQCLEVTLRSKLGWTAEEIDEQPLSAAFFSYFKYAEGEGSITLMTDEEFDFIEKNKKEKEAVCGS